MTSTVTQTRRKFSRLVDDPVLEDYSLRYAPSTFRRWSEFTVAMSALGGIAYLEKSCHDMCKGSMKDATPSTA